ncbi:eukaryotic translation initiation factor 4B3-like [Prosopis cineraria]|uniref:eukaryotic translation initiation factor 4B3-like n=1 Tax=Prosopis cineraria TaxID=364024 RepID=UPI00240ED5B1|nr:eukaryotic translation initiation factor 4B3-like [Prosopis cineraria]
MAASVSAWSKPGAWALDSEEHEAELLQQKDKDDTSQFPSLAVAAATKPKKKKGQTIPLADFTTYGGPKPSQASHSDGLTHEDLMLLPTGPRHRTAEELERDRSRLGGGFRSYGSYDRPNRNSGGDESFNSRWGSSRVCDEPRRNGSFGRDSNREMAPSRADEIDNWTAAKKPIVGNGFERRERDRGGFFDSQSRADESDSWVANKNYVPSEGRRFGSNGGGFERDRKVGFGSSGGADSDNWNRKKGEFNGGSGIDRIETPSGRPRLNLQPRSLPLSNGSQEGSGNLAKPKGPNPFGDAKPREEVLAEKGQDWKKIDQQLDAMKIKETVEKNDGFGRRGFGSGDGRASLPEERAERSWRKAVSDDSRPTSAEKSEDGQVEEN